MNEGMAPEFYYRRPEGIRTRSGAGGVVARREGERVLVALIRRPGQKEYALPKGGVEKGETLEEAAAREIREEAGFRKLKLLGELGVGERLTGRKTAWQTTHYFLFVTEEVEGKPTDRHNWEVEWFDLAALPGIYWQEQERLIRENGEMIRERVRGET